MRQKIAFHDLQDFRRLYWEGWPEARIARHFSIGRPIVRRIIKELGLMPRSCADSNRFLAEERTVEERRAQTSAASAARWRHVE